MAEDTIVAVTGHRPRKIGGYDPNNPLRQRIRMELRAHLERLQPVHTITGMALGVDQDFADVCLVLKIPFVAAVPFVGQESQWPVEAQQSYRELLSLALRVEVVSEGRYRPWKMQRRNEWMVDNCTHLIGVWDGSAGGTANCLRYAHEVGRDVLRVHVPPRWN